MDRPRIVIKKSATDYKGYILLGSVVYSRMSGNEYFPEAQPRMEVLKAVVHDSRMALARWGMPGNRGSSADLRDLREKTGVLALLLKELAHYVQKVAYDSLGSDYGAMVAVMISSGFVVSKGKKPQGPLEPVGYLKKNVFDQFSPHEVELTWKKPRNLVSASNLKEYIIYRADTPDFSMAMPAGRSRICKFRDINLTGVPVTWYYWIVPVGRNGNGVVAGPIQVSLFPGDGYMNVVKTND